jgi:hypothetical protein
MRARFLIAFVAVVLAVPLVAPIAARQADFIWMCHRDRSGGLNLIIVSANAVPAHQAHGDPPPVGVAPAVPPPEICEVLE